MPFRICQAEPSYLDTLILLFQFLLSHHKFIQIFKIIQTFIKFFLRSTKKIRTADNIDNSYFILSIFVRTPNAEITHQKVLLVRGIQGLRRIRREIFIMRIFLGLRRLNNRSILYVCEDYSIKRNDKITL